MGLKRQPTAQFSSVGVEDTQNAQNEAETRFNQAEARKKVDFEFPSGSESQSSTKKNNLNTLSTQFRVEEILAGEQHLKTFPQIKTKKTLPEINVIEEDVHQEQQAEMEDKYDLEHAPKMEQILSSQKARMSEQELATNMAASHEEHTRNLA